MHEHKYYTKEELMCIANYNENKLDKVLEELEEIGTIIIEGWLVRLVEYELLHQKLTPELELIRTKTNTQS